MMYASICRSLILVLALSACQTTSPTKIEKVASKDPIKPQLNFDQTQFNLVAVPSVEDIFKLSDKHAKHFLDYYHAPENAALEEHKRLYKFLDDRIGNFDFLGQTYTAQETVKHDAGNCLSLAIYTKALANLVGLDIAYRRVDSAPIYKRYHNVMTLSSHVQTILYAPKSEMRLISRARIIVDYFPQRGNVRAGKVTNEDFISMFYQNLAGDELVKENYDLAYSLLHEALKHSPYNPNTLNTLAVLFKAVRKVEQAEQIYKFVIEHTKGSVNAISNYIVLLEQQSRFAEAKQLEDQYDDIDDDNPYRWLDIGDNLFSNRRFDFAIRFYKRAVNVAPYLHEVHFALAKAYYQLGDELNAQVAMKNALSLAYVPSEQMLYKAKLSVFEEN